MSDNAHEMQTLKERVLYLEQCVFSPEKRLKEDKMDNIVAILNNKIAKANERIRRLQEQVMQSNKSLYGFIQEMTASILNEFNNQRETCAHNDSDHKSSLQSISTGMNKFKFLMQRQIIDQLQKVYKPCKEIGKNIKRKFDSTIFGEWRKPLKKECWRQWRIWISL